MPVELRGTWLASTVSGKGLAAYTGLSMVFHDGRLAPAGALPRYVDLAAYEESAGVPYSQSSNLVAALDCALASTSWPARFQRVAATDRELRAALAGCDLAPLVHHDVGTPGILTVPVPADIDAVRIARAMQADGIALASESEYLRHRNWLQICLMGECDVASARRIPGLLDTHVHPRAARSAHGGLAQSLHG
jgi:aspartate aminotransferase-like enzyme